MPTITRLERKPKSNFHSKTASREVRQKAYNSTAWRKLRTYHIKTEPLCQMCLSRGIIRPADSVHHKLSPFRNGEVDWTLFLDPDNLLSICRQCHGEEHGREESPEETIEKLDELLNNVDNTTEDEDK